MRIHTSHYSGTRGLYVKAIPDFHSVSRLQNLVEQTNPPFEVDQQNFHATIICSDVIPRSIYIFYPRKDLITRLVKAEYWVGQNGKGFAVLRLNSRTFNAFQRQYEGLGAVHKYKGGYIPHVTAGMEIGVHGNDIASWLFRMNSAIHFFNPLLVFNRIRVRDIRF